MVMPHNRERACNSVHYHERNESYRYGTLFGQMKGHMIPQEFSVHSCVLAQTDSAKQPQNYSYNTEDLTQQPALLLEFNP